MNEQAELPLDALAGRRLRRGPVGEESTSDRVCAAAMKCFAAVGADATSLREVAACAGVSVGLVQHHFGSKSALIAAVDDRLVSILSRAAPRPDPGPDPVTDLGQRLASLIGEHPDAVDYLARVLIGPNPSGVFIFDTLYDLGKGHWNSLQQSGRTRPDLDPAWGTLNPLVLVLGTLILHSHIDRQLPETLTAAPQLKKWELAVSALIDGGQVPNPLGE